MIAALLVASCSHAEPKPAALRDGDIVFQTSQSGPSLAIQRATDSPYSHMGIVLYRDGKPYVLEAIATVRYTPLLEWVNRGKGRRFVAKRLRDGSALSPEAIAKLRAVAQTYEGRRYDLTFEWSDDRIYCSELVWKIYETALGLRIGALQTLREFRLDDPAVQAKLKERYGSSVPLDEPVISPKAMFESDLLETIAR